MRTKILFASVAMAAISILSSCKDDEIVSMEQPIKQIITAEMAESAELQQSRSCVDLETPSTEFTGLLWQPADKIGVYSENGSTGNHLFTNTATENVPKAEFGGTMSGTPCYAYFPYHESNNSQSVTNLMGAVLAEQPFNPDNGTLACDYKYGKLTDATNNQFTFQQLFTMLRVSIDAAETELEGEHLESVTLKVTSKDGKQRNICGDFTFSAVDGTWSTTGNLSGTVTMPWTTKPVLAKGQSLQGFITIMPDVLKEDKISIEVLTENHLASFTADCQVAFKAGYLYDIPLTLKEFAKNSDKFGYVVEKFQVPTITTFALNVSDNTGKLLNNQLTWNSSKHTPSFTSVSSHSATINEETGEITLTIPYLYDFKLKPRFTLSSSDDCAVTVNGVSQVSGSTEVDFTQPVTYTLSNKFGRSRNYTVKVTNTGLPVVVVKHSTSGDFSKVTSGGFLGIGATTHNQFVDFWIRGKDTDWVEDDQITVYNADGTVDCSVTGGARLRGNTSQVYPKKPFALKFTEKKSVLGMPKHKRWVLLANWLDHSMIRNTVAFDIAQSIEKAWRENGSIEAGVPWNVHGKNVELIVVDKDGDAHHVGNYYLCEQIKIDENRLNISKPYEDGGNGNLFEIDTNYDENYKFKTSNGVPFMFKDDVTDAIVSSVKTKIQGIETNINNGNFDAAFNDLDINSVIDQMLTLELAMNREYGDPRSVYMFMDGNGKLSGGPVWDFDRGTFQNPSKAEELCDNNGPKGSSGKYYRVKPYDEWLYWRNGTNQETDSYSYVWYRGLAKSAVFQAKVQERWAVIKPYLDKIPEMINMHGQSLAVSYKYDSAMWPTTKDDIRKYKSDFNDWSGDETLGANGNYQEVISNFITVYQNRLAGLNTLITSGKFTK